MFTQSSEKCLKRINVDYSNDVLSLSVFLLCMVTYQYQGCPTCLHRAHRPNQSYLTVLVENEISIMQVNVHLPNVHASVDLVWRDHRAWHLFKSKFKMLISRALLLLSILHTMEQNTFSLVNKILNADSRWRRTCTVYAQRRDRDRYELRYVVFIRQWWYPSYFDGINKKKSCCAISSTTINSWHLAVQRGDHS